MIFQNTREDVKDFLETTNLSLMEREKTEKLLQIEQVARQMPTPGQVADASQFHSRLSTLLAGHYEDFEDVYEQFVAEFDHIFFNAFGDKTIEDLLETQSWRGLSDSLRGVGIFRGRRQPDIQSCRTGTCSKMVAHQYGDASFQDRAGKTACDL